MRVGVDFDNTLVLYDAAFREVGRALSLLPEGFTGGKRAVRDRVRALPDGERSWQRLQAEVYGREILRARPAPGALEFLARCRELGVPVFIVSHKSRFPGSGDAVDLREAAQGWLRAHGLVGAPGLGEGRIFFEDTRAAKIARIRAVGCTHFVDDLEEVFLEADFPEHVERHLIIMDADDERKAGPYRMHADWSSIAEAVLGPEERLRSLAERLAGATPTSIELCRRGGNNRVYRVETTRGLSALKVYPSIAEDPRDRLGREHRSLAFLAPRLPKGLVPAPLAIDREARAALYEWVEGVPVNAIDASARHGQDVDAVVRLLAALHEIGSEGQDLPEATEPCLAASELLARLDARLGPLKAASGNEPELGSFLESVFEPLAALARSDLLEVYARLGWSLAARIERSRQTLSPSDFGFHNALRRGSGALAFVDFEYFGWDDPVKASSDFLWHAGMKLSPAERTAFLEGACGAFGDDETFADRLAAQFPLHGLHWCLLVLNEFLPERWKRRVLAGASESWEMAKRAQLEKARSILTRVRAVRESRASLRNLVAAGATQ